MYKYHPKLSEFSLEGQILDLLVEEGKKLKYLRIATPLGREYLVKLSKELRVCVAHTLIPGDWVQVAGEKKLDKETGNLKLKAYSLRPTGNKNCPVAVPQTQPTCPKAQAKIACSSCTPPVLLHSTP